MALDEALLEAAAGPTARTYTWRRATLSLGYFQDHDAVLASLPPDVDPDVVRRITGGGAIWHEHEVTYCLVGVLAEAGFPGRARDCYGPLHAAIHAAIARRRGTPLATQDATVGDRRYRSEPRCFASPAAGDLVAGRGAKVLGSAARTRGRRILIHGSLKLASNPWDGPTVVGCGLATDAAAAAIIDGIAAFLGTDPTPDGLRQAESRARDRIREERYGDDAWVRHRLGPRP